jgi:lipopolysaccharide export system ATP-binding protein
MRAAGTPTMVDTAGGRRGARPDTPRARATGVVTATRAAGALAARGLRKVIGGRAVVHDVSLALAPGEAVGLLGPNGAGKTTTFYILTGLVAADAGRVVVDGQDVTGLPMHRRARLGLGYLPQEASIFRGLDVEQNLLAVLELVEPDRHARRQRLAALLDEFQLRPLRKAAAMALSGGERRRVEIARALATKPRYILLDEPLAGIDPVNVGEIRDLVAHLKERGLGVLITDHNVRDTLDIIDRAYVLHEGRVLAHGTPAEIVADPAVRQVYLGDRFSL